MGFGKHQERYIERWGSHNLIVLVFKSYIHGEVAGVANFFFLIGTLIAHYCLYIRIYDDINHVFFALRLALGLKGLLP